MDGKPDAKFLFDANRELANSLVGQGRNEDAVTAFSVLIRQYPGTHGFHHNRAFAHQFLEQFDLAKLDAERALELAPSTGYARGRLAQVYHATGQYEKAIEGWEAQLQVTPGNPYPRWLIAKSLVEMGKYGEALASHSLGVKQKGYLGHEHYAWLLSNCPEEKHRDFPKALEMLRIARPSPKAERWNTYGAVLYRLGEFEQAIEVLEKALQCESDTAKFNDCMKTSHHFFLAMAHQRLAHHESAKKHYELALSSTESSLQKLAELARQPSHTVHRTVKDLESLRDEAAEVLHGSQSSLE